MPGFFGGDWKQPFHGNFPLPIPAVDWNVPGSINSFFVGWSSPLNFRNPCGHINPYIQNHYKVDESIPTTIGNSHERLIDSTPHGSPASPGLFTDRVSKVTAEQLPEIRITSCPAKPG